MKDWLNVDLEIARVPGGSDRFPDGGDGLVAGLDHNGQTPREARDIEVDLDWHTCGPMPAW